jgi:hypothetical protein
MKKRLSSSYFWISRVSIFVFIENRQLMDESFQIFGDYQQEQAQFRRRISTRNVSADTSAPRHTLLTQCNNMLSASFEPAKADDIIEIRNQFICAIEPVDPVSKQRQADGRIPGLWQRWFPKWHQ